MPADGFSGKSFDIGTVVSIISGIAFVPEENMYRVLWFMTGEKIRAVEWLIYQIEACAPYLRKDIVEAFGEDGLGGGWKAKSRY